MEDKELDITAEPIKLELGISLCDFIADTDIKIRFLSWIEEFRTEVKQQEKIEIPAIHIVDNIDLNPKEYRIIIYGKVITNTLICLKNNIERQIFHGLKSQLKQNLYCFKKDFWVCKEKLEEMRHEQSRETYEFLYSYYTNIEPNKQKAFHWLKKLSYFECPNDIHLLIRCYSFGDGCEQDHILAEKLRCKYISNYFQERKRRF